MVHVDLRNHVELESLYLARVDFERKSRVVVLVLRIHNLHLHKFSVQWNAKSLRDRLVFVRPLNPKM
jgi:hypothetical protein